MPPLPLPDDDDDGPPTDPHGLRLDSGGLRITDGPSYPPPAPSTEPPRIGDAGAHRYLNPAAGRRTPYVVAAVAVAAITVGAVVAGAYQLWFAEESAPVAVPADPSSSSRPALAPATAPARTDDVPVLPETPVSERPGMGAGIYEVGTDVPAGTYRTQGPVDDAQPCIWVRRVRPGVTIAGSATGAFSVRIRASDLGFDTAGCQRWEKVS